MSSNVHALEKIRPLRSEVDRPDRADVEAAFRTIIRWTGDDPEREGLIRDSISHGTLVRRVFCRLRPGPSRIPAKNFEEIEGYDEMIVLRGIRFESQ